MTRVTLVLLAALVAAGCGEASVGDGGQVANMARLAVASCEAHDGVQTVIYSSHSGKAGIICRDQTIIEADQ